MRLFIISLSFALATSAAMAASQHSNGGKQAPKPQHTSHVAKYKGHKGSVAAPGGPQKLKCEMEKCASK